MKKSLHLGLSTLLLAGSTVLHAGPQQADLLLRNGKIYTVDGKRSVQQAIAIRGNQIIGVGSDADLSGLISDKTEVIDLQGKTVLPGLIDAHSHPIWGSVSLSKCNLTGVAAKLPALREAVQDCIKNNRGVSATGWIDATQLTNYGFSATARDLDQIESQHPLIIYGNDGHSLWANSRAMKEANITASTKAPEGGKISHGSDGQPDGLFSDSAINMFVRFTPNPSVEKMADLTAKSLQDMNTYGITSLQDAYVDNSYLSVWKMLYDTGRLSGMRVRSNIYLEDTSDSSDARIAELKKKRDENSPDQNFLRTDGIKFFADGVVEAPSFTAALNEPYLDKDGKPTTNTGELYFKEKAFAELVRKLDAAKFAIQIHSIGDRATHVSLNAIEAARKSNGSNDNPHMIAHVQLTAKKDYPRFAELDVYPVMTLTWATPDVSNNESLKPYIGAQRHLTLYAANSLKKAGAKVVGGSDWDVSTYNPFIAMSVGVTRKTYKTDQPLNAAEGLTMQDMLEAYTIHAARAMRQDKTTGSLEVGKKADLVVIDRDILNVDARAVMETKVEATYVDGRRVYPL